MKKLTKLARDTRPQELPEGAYLFGKNGIQHYLQGAVINEPGFVLSANAIPYLPMGIIETDKFPVVFSTNNTYSAIGYIDTINDVYIPIVDDSLLTFKLGFSTNSPITGQSQRNYKGEIIVAFRAENIKPMCLNCDSPILTNLEALYLFPRASQPDVTIGLQAGGSLLPGAYYAAVRSVRNDGTETVFLATTSPAIVSGTAGQITDEGVLITVQNADPSYQLIQIAIISKIAGVVKAVLLDPIATTSNASLLYTGTEVTQDITLEEILVQPANYDRVGNIGQLNDALYLVDLKSAPEPKMQKFANLIRLKWASSLVSVIPEDKEMASGTKKTFMHQEVYAWYIKYKLTTGGTTRAFHIPGPELLPADSAISSLSSLEGLTHKVYQVEDTIPSFDLATRTGLMGKWQNATETYPNTADYDSTSVGGVDLRGQKVRHHRMPSIAWCKQNLYSSEVDYGRTKLDRLGVFAENVVVPAEYTNLITGWELYYAKRTPGNSSVVGQSLYLFGCRNVEDASGNVYMSSAGNWKSEIEFRSSPRRTLVDKQEVFHFHSFDMLFNRPSVSPSYLSFQLKLQRLNIPATGGLIQDEAVISDNDGPIVYNIDYILNGQSPTLPTRRLKAIKETEYVPNNIKLGKWFNKGIEGFFGGVMTNPETLIPPMDISLQLCPVPGRTGWIAPSKAVQKESTFLTNMLSVHEEIYTSFTGQSLVRAGASKFGPQTPVYGGDTFIVDYTFHTYGETVADHNYAISAADLYKKGVKAARRFVCETAANLYARYEITGNAYSKYYPKSSMIVEDPTNYLVAMSRDQDPNQFGYNKDLNALDDFTSSRIFNTYEEDIIDHPYRIHRGGKLQKQTKNRSWQTFLSLDYYEAQKNMGRLMHCEGMDDRLLLHFEHALMLTQDKTRLESDILAVTLGSGDIFQFQPQEAMSAKLGWAGTQHKLACVRTPFGYAFLDAEQGQVFLYKGGLQEINGLLSIFFYDYLRMKEANPYIGNGFTIGYDPVYKRLMLTCKNVHLSSGVKPPVYTPDMLATITPGTRVFKDGRLQEFVGLNTSAFACSPILTPVVPDIVITKPEDTPVTTLLTTVVGTDFDSVYITTAQTEFGLGAVSGNLRLLNPLVLADAPYTLHCKAVNSRFGTFSTFTITVNVTAISKKPTIDNAEVVVPSGTLVGTLVHSPTYTSSGTPVFTKEDDPTDKFNIDAATGDVTWDSTVDPIPTEWLIKVRITDAYGTAIATLKVTVLEVDAPPTHPDIDITVYDSTPIGTIILALDPVDSPNYHKYTYGIRAENHPGVIQMNSDFTLFPASHLNFMNTYVLTMEVQNSAGVSPFTVTIHVVIDPEQLKFVPEGGICLGGTVSCTAGYTLSSDGLSCVKVNTMAATVVDLGGCLAPAPNAVYANAFSRIYNPGFSNSSIKLTVAPSADVYAEMTLAGQWKNAAGTTTDGPANRIGMWRDSDCNGTPDALSFGAKATMYYKYVNTGAARTVYVGCFGDNEFTLKMNSSTIAQTDGLASTNHFNIFHIFPVNIVSGDNLFNLEATGDGSTNDSFGMIIFDNTPADIAAATSDASLNVLFTSHGLSGTAFPVASCPPGWTLDIVAGAPICKQTLTSAPITSTSVRHWPWVKVIRTDTNVEVARFVNDAVVKNFEGITVPFYPDVPDHIDCGGTTYTWYNAPYAVSRSKTTCAPGLTGSLVRYAKPGGIFVSTVSQTDADNMAAADVTANAQTYADTHGTCN